MAERSQVSAWGFVAFPLAVIVIFTALPTVVGIALSFCYWQPGGTPTFIGLNNYTELFRSAMFWPALRNTLIIAFITVPVTIVLAFLFAAALNARWFVGRTMLRTVFFAPTVISIVAIGFIWRWVLSPSQSGLLNHVLIEYLCVIETPISWLENSPLGLATVCAITIWRGIGFSLVLYLAALTSVPRSLYESAAVDGATGWKALWHITWPSVKPMTLFLIIIGMIQALQTFDLIVVMIGTTQQQWTDVLNLFLYREFIQDRLGFAAAIGVVILLLTAIVTAGQLGYVRYAERVRVT